VARPTAPVPMNLHDAEHNRRSFGQGAEVVREGGACDGGGQGVRVSPIVLVYLRGELGRQGATVSASELLCLAAHLRGELFELVELGVDSDEGEFALDDA
jgi:hypothetical protein